MPFWQTAVVSFWDAIEFDWSPCEAPTAVAAARMAAEAYDTDGDYYLAKDSRHTVEIQVRAENSDETWRFSCSAETVPLYYANEIKKCSECGVNYADPPSPLCPGCEAYREHIGD